MLKSIGCVCLSVLLLLWLVLPTPLVNAQVCNPVQPLDFRLTNSDDVTVSVSSGSSSQDFFFSSVVSTFADDRFLAVDWSVEGSFSDGDQIEIWVSLAGEDFVYSWYRLLAHNPISPLPSVIELPSNVNMQAVRFTVSPPVGSAYSLIVDAVLVEIPECSTATPTSTATFQLPYTPTPTVTPTEVAPTATPSTVDECRQYDFTIDEQGWEKRNPAGSTVYVSGSGWRNTWSGTVHSPDIYLPERILALDTIEVEFSGSASTHGFIFTVWDGGGYFIEFPLATRSSEMYDFTGEGGATPVEQIVFPAVAWDIFDNGVFISAVEVCAVWSIPSSTPTPTVTGTPPTATPSPTGTATSTSTPSPTPANAATATSQAATAVATIQAGTATAIAGATATSQPLPGGGDEGPATLGSIDVVGGEAGQVITSPCQIVAFVPTEFRCSYESIPPFSLTGWYRWLSGWFWYLLCQGSKLFTPLFWIYDWLRISYYTAGFASCNIKVVQDNISAGSNETFSLMSDYYDFLSHGLSSGDIPALDVTGDAFGCNIGVFHLVVKNFILGSVYIAPVWEFLILLVSLSFVVSGLRMVITGQFIPFFAPLVVKDDKK